MVTSKPRSQSEKDLIRVKAWTSSQKHPDNAKSHHSETAKIVLFVQVLRGDSPIIGAKVMAAIKLESMTNNGTTVEYLPSVNLQDNGYGGKFKTQYFTGSVIANRDIINALRLHQFLGTCSRQYS